MMWHQFIACFALGLALSQVQEARGQATGSITCAPGFHNVAGKCLLPLTSFNNWFEADRTCRYKKGGLLTLINEKELDEISKWINTTLPAKSELWTSGNSLGRRGTYYWQNTGEEARYLPWLAGQPVVSDGDCLVLTTMYTVKGNPRLAVRNCELSTFAVCEQLMQYTGAPVQTATRICLRPDSFESAQVLIN